MKTPETEIGGGGNAFPETAWSSILSDPNADSPVRRERLNALCSTYWRPVYSFIRAAWGKSIEEAKDLAQGYFCHLIETDLVLRYHSDKGRFRGFLLGTLKNFLADENRRENALKRGAGKNIVSLDSDVIARLDTVSSTPEDLFNRQWARDVLAQAIRRLEEVLAAEGKQSYFAAYRAYDLAPGADRPTYAQIAADLNILEHDVTNRLSYCRSRLHELILETVRAYVTSHDELLEEMKELFNR